MRDDSNNKLENIFSYGILLSIKQSAKICIPKKIEKKSITDKILMAIGFLNKKAKALKTNETKKQTNAAKINKT